MVPCPLFPEYYSECTSGEHWLEVMPISTKRQRVGRSASGWTSRIPLGNRVWEGDHQQNVIVTSSAHLHSFSRVLEGRSVLFPRGIHIESNCFIEVF